MSEWSGRGSLPVLFTAPFGFLPTDLFERSFLSVERREVWHESDLLPDPNVVGWITNTGWSFKLGPAQAALYPKLKVIVTPSTGTDHIAVDELRARGLRVLSLLDDREGLAEIAASAEHAFLLLLTSLRRLPFATRAFDNRMWRRDMEDELRGRELQGRRIGLVGYGRIGRRMAVYCQAFGATTAYFDPYVTDGYGLSTRSKSLLDLFRSCDSIVVCCTFDESTRGLVGAELLRAMRPGATLVNIARGEVIDEEALAAVIVDRPDVGVSLDVLSGEPSDLQFQSPVVPHVDQNRVTVTPHIGGSTIESQSKAAIIALRLIEDALE